MQLVTRFINEPSQRASNYFEIRSKAAPGQIIIHEWILCIYLPPWECKLLRFQYYFVGVQFHWLMLMQTISLYRSRPDPRESVRNSSSVYQDTRYQDFHLIAMSAIRSKIYAATFYTPYFFTSNINILFVPDSTHNRLTRLYIVNKLNQSHLVFNFNI